MKESKKGFTLTEVLVVIVIVGIVLTIAIPSVILVRKRINKRVFEEKKELILVAASLYGKDKGITSDTIIPIDELLKDGYINADLQRGEGSCTSNYGCVVDDEGNIITDVEILLKKTSFDVIAIWNGTMGSSDSEDLVEDIKDDLNCPEVISASTPCLYPPNASNNYLYMSGIMWRIVGIYNIGSKEVAKLITDDTVVWEE